jgi:hypothetical protein
VNPNVNKSCRELRSQETKDGINMNTNSPRGNAIWFSADTFVKNNRFLGTSFALLLFIDWHIGKGINTAQR